MLIPGPTAVSNGFIFNPSGDPIVKKNYREASVDLTAGHMLSSNDKEIKTSTEEIIIKPQQTAVIISKECFNIPKGVIAQALMKNRMSQDGLIAFNTGIVDDQYQKPISTMVTNLSKNDIVIKHGQPFLRIVFHRLDQDDLTHLKPNLLSNEQAKKNIKDYVSYRKSDIAKLPRDFFAVSDIKDKIVGDLREYSIAFFFTKLAATVSLIVVVMSLLNAFVLEPKASKDESYEKDVIENNLKIEMLEQRIYELEKKELNTRKLSDPKSDDFSQNRKEQLKNL